MIGASQNVQSKLSSSAAEKTRDALYYLWNSRHAICSARHSPLTQHIMTAAENLSFLESDEHHLPPSWRFGVYKCHHLLTYLLTYLIT